MAGLSAIHACVGPLYTLHEALNDKHAQARGVTISSGSGDNVFSTLPTFPRISGVEDDQRYPPPAMGEHTDELLRQAGYNETEIEQFKTGGAI